MAEKQSGVDAATVAAAPSLEGRCWVQVLYLDLEVILRQSLNGHPIGHDAIATASRHLKKCAVEVAGRPAHLQCNCSACSLARRRNPAGDAAAATAATKADTELVRCQCGSLAVIETPAYGGARYKCDECGADWISSAAATAATNKEASA